MDPTHEIKNVAAFIERPKNEYPTEVLKKR